MEDMDVIALYNSRAESAIRETDSKYGKWLHTIAFNILANREDSEEIVSDTYTSAWNTIPPQQPNSLRAYLGRITRNLSINRWHARRAQRRYNGAELLLSELADCLPAGGTVESALERKELARAIDRWLSGLPVNDRVLFLRRYWFADAVNVLAQECATSANKLAGRLFRLRRSLKAFLEQEGISL